MNDATIRFAAMAAARSLIARWGDAVPYNELVKGFVVESQRILSMSKAEGVFKPAQMTRGVLSISSRLKAHYSDEPVSDTRTFYDYSPKPERNQWIRDAMAAGEDVIYLLQVKTKPNPEYVVFAPVRIVEDDPERRRFVVDLLPAPRPLYDPSQLKVGPIPRLYDSATVKVRLFQAHFRRVVLEAYQGRCCVCSLPERPLLDSAHITPDSEETGEPVVNNGLAMCALHHRAFDAELLGVTPEYRVTVNEARLQHPTDQANRVLLDHRGQRIRLPRDETSWPDRERLERRHSVDSR
jgi:putative restriction endonuclease